MTAVLPAHGLEMAGSLAGATHMGEKRAVRTTVRIPTTPALVTVRRGCSHGRCGLGSGRGQPGGGGGGGDPSEGRMYCAVSRLASEHASVPIPWSVRASADSVLVDSDYVDSDFPYHKHTTSTTASPTTLAGSPPHG